MGGHSAPIGFQHEPTGRSHSSIDTTRIGHSTWHLPFDACPVALMPQQIDDLLRAAVAKQLPQFFFVIADAMRLDQLDKVLRSEACQRRSAEMRIVRQEIFWFSV